MKKYQTFRLKGHFHLSNFFLYTPISILAIPITFSNQIKSITDLIQQLSIGLFVTTIAGILFYFAKLISDIIYPVSNNKKSFFWIVSIIIIGSARGYLINFTIDRFGFDEIFSVTTRMLVSTINVVLWLVIFAIVTDSNKTFRTKYLALLSQAILIRGKKHENTTSLTPNISAEIDLLQKNIDGLVSKALDQGITSESLRSAAIHIRNQIESNLKPLQRKLWNRTLSAQPKYRFTLLLKYAIVNPNYNFWRILFAFSMLNMVNLGGFLTLNQGISILILNNLLVMFWVKVHQKFNKRISRGLFPNATLLLCSSATLGTLSSTSIEILRGAPWPLSATVSLSVILLTLIVLESMFSLREQDRASLLRILDKGIIRELEDSSSSTYHSNTKVASYLHNSYQSELYGIIAQLQLAAARPDDSDTKAVLEKLGAVINRSVSEDFVNFQKSPSERLERMIESWKGLVDIQIQFPDEHRIDKDRIGLVVEVIEEAVANAVRLGNADKIVVDTFLDKGYLKIIIEDNGQGPIAGGKGLGGQWLDRFALEEWNLEKTSVGTKLTVII